MIKLVSILWNSFLMALQELRVNKLRTFLSLFGITIGIFCIIGVLATINSLEGKIQADIQSFGSNTIYIDKWEYTGGAEYPWWKFVNRPSPKYEEVNLIKERSTLSKYVCYFNSITTNIKYQDDQLSNVNIYGVTEDFDDIQTIEIAYGRYLNQTDFERALPFGVIGYTNAELLFGKPEKALGKQVIFDGKAIVIAGVIKKQGQSIIDGFEYDRCLILPYRSFAGIYDVNSRNTQPFLMVNGFEDISTIALIDELRGVMRQIRRLSPRMDDNFALNDVNNFSQSISGFFGQVNAGGWAIAGISLLVGAFGVANIMFVTVRERTSQIGLKKAIGAKSRTILTEFLLESAFLCIIGGLLGLLLVWGVTAVLSTVSPFPITISADIISLAFSICILLGILAGIIPASIAARMNPVVAIRSK
jgi:putative ABC transport system permease protein